MNTKELFKSYNISMDGTKKLRIYRVDEKENDYLYYEDRDTHFLIRSAMDSDEDMKILSQVSHNTPLEQFRKIIKGRSNGKFDCFDCDVCIVEKANNHKPIGVICMFHTDEDVEYVVFDYKNTTIESSYKNFFEKALINLCSKEHFASELYSAREVMISEDEELVAKGEKLIFSAYAEQTA